MNANKPKYPSGKNPGSDSKSPEQKPPTPPRPPAAPPPPGPVAPLFRQIDWLAFGLTTLLVFIGYWLTLAPDVTLEDSGELAVASMYAGVPHPPGYPVWTIYTWLFTLLPISNIAFRVGLSQAVAGALASGLIALMVSRGSSMIIEGIEELRGLPKGWESALCVVAGFVSGMFIGYNGFMWSQAVIVEVYGLSVLSLAGVLACLLRWTYAPHQHRYLYLAFFWFGICFNNHQSLLVVAIGLEVAIVAVQPTLGRELFFWNVVCWIGGLVGREMDLINVLKDNDPLLNFYNAIGISSAVGWIYLAFKTRMRWIALGRNFALVGSLVYVMVVLGDITGYVGAFEYKTGLFILFNLVGLAVVAACVYLILITTAPHVEPGKLPSPFNKLWLQRFLSKEWVAALLCGLGWMLGAAFYLYMPLASMSNPPLNWGYPRTVQGFFHAFTRGQYERIHPTTSLSTYWDQIGMYIGGALDEFNLIFLLLAIVPFLFFKRLQKRERAWLIGLAATYLCLSFMLLILLNPAPDRQSRDLNRVFFTASHVMLTMFIGYSLTLIGAALITQYERYRKWVLIGSGVLAAIGLYGLASALSEVANPLMHYTAVLALVLPAAVAVILLYARAKLPAVLLLAVFAAMPLWSVMSHWEDNEQRGHYFGYWFGHDMFTPPFKDPKTGQPIYPTMARDTVLFGGTDPGRFVPTYMIFCESFIPNHKKPAEDPTFDRRDVYLITQNALADGTYLNYIRAQYNRSTQLDPPFFSELLRGRRELEAGVKTNILARLIMPVDRFFLSLGDRIEKRRRAGTSYFKGQDFKDLPGFVAKLRPGPAQDPLSKYLFEHFTKSTQDLISKGGSKPPAAGTVHDPFAGAQDLIAKGLDPALRSALARDLNALLEKEYHERRRMEDELDAITQSSADAAEKDKLLKARVQKYRDAKVQLFDPERFQQIKLSDRTLRFIRENPRSYTLIRLDRILLEEAYPTQIATSLGGVYPDREINTPTPDDSQRCFQEYLADAQRRLAVKQLRPGEDVRLVDNKVQVSGQVAVMAINGLLTKVIFEKNPDHEFYVEESFPLEWMYPYLTPYGIIMKINRDTVPELTEEMVHKDHEFWSQYSQRLVGNWITYDTTVSNICAFAEKVYHRRNFKGFKGAPEFIRDNDGQKAFSKLRSSIAGVYAWRVQQTYMAVQRLGGELQQASAQNNPPEVARLNGEYQRKNADFQRMLKEADFAFKQAYAFCPYSPEALFRYINLLVTYMGRFDDARMLATASKNLDPYNTQIDKLVQDLEAIRHSPAPPVPSAQVPAAPSPEQVQAQVAPLEKQWAADPANAQLAYSLATLYVQGQQPDKALQLADRLIANPQATKDTLLVAAQFCNQLGQLPRAEQALARIVKVTPENPEAWFDLAAVQTALNRNPQAIDSLRQALTYNAKRLAADPKAPNLFTNAQNDPRLNNLRPIPAFQQLLAQPPAAPGK
jgi:tetratricopeptide (TPR) repeat protein